MLEVYLADDDAEVRRALRLMLEQRLGIRIAGEAAHTHGLAPLVEATRADIVLVDWDLPHRVDAWLIKELHQLSQRPIVIVASSQADARDAALAAGAEAVADKSEAPESLLLVVQQCLRGKEGARERDRS
jgi:DNA-binding NarL/FixJ family response regulator